MKKITIILLLTNLITFGQGWISDKGNAYYHWEYNIKLETGEYLQASTTVKYAPKSGYLFEMTDGNGEFIGVSSDKVVIMDEAKVKHYFAADVVDKMGYLGFKSINKERFEALLLTNKVLIMAFRNAYGVPTLTVIESEGYIRAKALTMEEYD